MRENVATNFSHYAVEGENWTAWSFNGNDARGLASDGRCIISLDPKETRIKNPVLVIRDNHGKTVFQGSTKDIVPGQIIPVGDGKIKVSKHENGYGVGIKWAEGSVNYCKAEIYKGLS